MMKRLLIAAIGATVATGCGHFGDMLDGANRPQVIGSGKSTTQSRSVGRFKAVELDGAFETQVKIGRAGEVSIEGDDNIVPLVKTETRGDTLRIFVDANYSSKTPLGVTLSTDQLSSAVVNGSGNLSMAGIKGEELSLALNGSAEITGTGEVSSLAVTINGSGDVDLTRLRTQRAQVAINGSGDIQLNASKSLGANIAGSGSVRYSGNPKDVSRSVIGSGDIKAVE